MQQQHQRAKKISIQLTSNPHSIENEKKYDCLKAVRIV